MDMKHMRMNRTRIGGAFFLVVIFLFLDRHGIGSGSEDRVSTKRAVESV